MRKKRGGPPKGTAPVKKVNNCCMHPYIQLLIASAWTTISFKVFIGIRQKNGAAPREPPLNQKGVGEPADGAFRAREYEGYVRADGADGSI